MNRPGSIIPLRGNRPRVVTYKKKSIVIRMKVDVYIHRFCYNDNKLQERLHPIYHNTSLWNIELMAFQTWNVTIILGFYDRINCV